ncbi:MAG: Protocatechuate 3,4-dioxygenase beta chain, partial [uncultured Craurococcus sp.]
ARRGAADPLRPAARRHSPHRPDPWLSRHLHPHAEPTALPAPARPQRDHRPARPPPQAALRRGQPRRARPRPPRPGPAHPYRRPGGRRGWPPRRGRGGGTLAGQCRRPLRPPERCTFRSARSALHRQWPGADGCRGTLWLLHHPPRRLSRARRCGLVAPAPCPFFRARAIEPRAAGDADVLPWRPAECARPHLHGRAQRCCPRTPDRPRPAAGGGRLRLARLPARHRAARPPGDTRAAM